MTGNVVDFKRAQKSKEPLLRGNVVCTQCGVIEDYVAPVGTHQLWCRHCKDYTGVWESDVWPEGSYIWSCDKCGDTRFRITEAAAFCVTCGEASDPRELLNGPK